MQFRNMALRVIPLVILAGLAVATLLSAQRTQIACGVVRDTAGFPVAGAGVRVRGGDAYVRADARGAFRIPVADAGVQITAWAPGYYIGGIRAGDLTDCAGSTLTLRPHPTTDNPAYVFVSPVLDMTNASACAHCHSDRTGENNGALPVDEWLLDAHSGAATNPRFLSVYNGITTDGTPGIPTVYTFDAAQGVNIPLTPAMSEKGVGPGFRLDFPDQTGSCATCHVPLLALAEPYAADPNHAEGVAAEGVTCDFCHKIQDVYLRPDGLPDPGLPGVLSYDLLRPPEGQQVFIGPYDDTPGDDIYSALQDESQICAPCHSGQFWGVKIYDSFGEWLASPYSDPVSGQTCQDCHMPHAGVSTFVQLPPDDPTIIPPRASNTIFSHRMPGAADQTLLENTAELDVQTRQTGDHLQVSVRVTNSGAGHHIPTDSPLRSMILLVRAVDQDGLPLMLTAGPMIPAWGGEGDPEQGYFAGQAGVLYAKILADSFTGETPAYAYWRPTRLVSDNRIAALAADDSVYTFALPADGASMTVDVRLYLRRAFIDLMDAKQWNTPDILMERFTVTLP